MRWHSSINSGEPTLPGLLLTPSQLLIGLQVTVSNPAEVAKTRLQLQGELAKDGGVKVYKNALDVFAKTWRNEGIRGMQRGLGAAVSTRLFVENFAHSHI